MNNTDNKKRVFINYTARLWTWNSEKFLRRTERRISGGRHRRNFNGLWSGIPAR